MQRSTVTVTFMVYLKTFIYIYIYIYIYVNYGYIKTSLDKLVDNETLSSQNKLFCPSCDTLTESTKETSTTSSSSVLIVQLTRFSILDNSNKRRTDF